MNSLGGERLSWCLLVFLKNAQSLPHIHPLRLLWTVAYHSKGFMQGITVKVGCHFFRGLPDSKDQTPISSCIAGEFLPLSHPKFLTLSSCFLWSICSFHPHPILGWPGIAKIFQVKAVQVSYMSHQLIQGVRGFVCEAEEGKGVLDQVLYREGEENQASLLQCLSQLFMSLTMSWRQVAILPDDFHPSLQNIIQMPLPSI